MSFVSNSTPLLLKTVQLFGVSAVLVKYVLLIFTTIWRSGLKCLCIKFVIIFLFADMKGRTLSQDFRDFESSYLWNGNIGTLKNWVNQIGLLIPSVQSKLQKSPHSFLYLSSVPVI